MISHGKPRPQDAAAQCDNRLLCQPWKEATMSKQQMINEIAELNAGASPEILMSFDETSLASYLKRLNELHNRRGPATRWVRLAETTAIVTRTQPPMTAAA